MIGANSTIAADENSAKRKLLLSGYLSSVKDMDATKHYLSGEAGERACNLYMDCIDIEIQTWPTFTTFSNMPNMVLTGTFT